MTIIHTLKKIVNKEDYDWERNDVTLQNFHPQIEIFFAIQGIFFRNRESKRRFIWPVLSSLMIMVGVGFELMFVWRGLTIKDYAMATESFVYLIVCGIVAVIYGSVLPNRDKIFIQVENMSEDFGFICNLAPNYRKCYLDGQLLIWKMCSYWMIFVTFVCIIYISNTFVILLYQSIFATMDEHMVRPLIFPVWLPHDDPHRSPNYEILMIYHIALIFAALSTFGLYVSIQLHLLLHCYKLMDVILIGIDELFDDLDESVVTLPQDHQYRKAVQTELNSRMGRIVRWHLSVFDSVDRITTIYGPVLVYQVLLSSVIICLLAYQVADQLSKGKFNYLFAILTCGATLQLFIPCYIGTLLGTKAMSIGDSCFYSGWYKTPLAQLVRQDLLILLLRAQQPVSIKFVCLPELNLETFSSIMSTAYSYFNMLRQYS